MPLTAIVGLSQPNRSHRDTLLSHFGERPGILLDSGGTIVAANAQAAALFGRSVEELTGTPLSLLNPLLPEAEFDIVTKASGRSAVKAIRATTLPLADGHKYFSVVLQPVAAERQPTLTQLVIQALGEASAVKPGCCSRVTLSFPAELRAAAGAREIVRDWILMLGDLASSQEASLHLAGVQRDGWVELQMCLREPEPELEAPNHSLSLVPDRAAHELFEMGGEFRVASEYPETQVWLKLRAA